MFYSTIHHHNPPLTPGTAALPRGVVLGHRYLVEGLLGSGGFARVYEGRDLDMDRAVAIKVMSLPAWCTSDEMRRTLLKRFYLEARCAARIEHPNVVTIHDMGTLDNGHHPYLIMSLMEGHALGEELKSKGAMSLPRALVLFERALGGLAVAHDQGIIHRDLKPANLFLTSPGLSSEDLCIFDFSIARFNDTPRLTDASTVVGTPRYLAPEVILGWPLTPALDVYQMGLAMSEAITGHPVVQDETDYLCVRRHGKGELELDPQIEHSALGPILKRALAHKPEARYRSAAEFQAALQRLEDKDVERLAQRRRTRCSSVLLESEEHKHHTNSAPGEDAEIAAKVSGAGFVVHFLTVAIAMMSFVMMSMVAAMLGLVAILLRFSF